MTRRYLISMASVVLVDLGITGIFLLVSGRAGVFVADFAVNIAVLGALNVAGAAVLFRPIRRFLAGTGGAEAARRRVERLAELSAAWAIVVTLIYCVVAFSLGIFWPEGTSYDALPSHVRAAAPAWFAFVYSAYYAFYVYFLNSGTVILKTIQPRRGSVRTPSPHRRSFRSITKSLIRK